MNSILNERLSKTWSHSTAPVKAAPAFSAMDVFNNLKPHPVSQGSREVSLYRYDWITYGILVIKLISSFMLEGGESF